MINNQIIINNMTINHNELHKKKISNFFLIIEKKPQRRQIEQNKIKLLPKRIWTELMTLGNFCIVYV